MSSKFEPGGETRYGPKLGDYLRTGAFDLSRLEPPSRGEILEAICRLYHPRKVSYSTLETILSLERIPTCKNLGLLVSESAGGAFPACLRLILEYCGDGKRQLLDHAYGFLCLRVLTLFIHCGALVQIDQLNNVLALVSNSCTSTSNSIFPAFSYHTWRIIKELMDQSEVNNDIWLFGWYNDPTTNKRICLPQIGGCRASDTCVLLDLLWPARSQFLNVAGWATGLFPGLCGLLEFMWSSLFQEYGDTNKTRNVRNLWNRFTDIVMRYAICSSEDEMQILPFMIFGFPRFIVESTFVSGFKSALNASDSAQIIRATSNRLRSSMNFPTSFGSIIFSLACPNIGSKRAEEHALELLTASLERMWFEIEMFGKDRELTLHQFEELSYYSMRILSGLVGIAGFYPQKFFQILNAIGEDLLDILGRLIVWPLSIYTHNGRIMTDLPMISELEECVTRFPQDADKFLCMSARDLPPVLPEARLIPVWYTTFRILAYRGVILDDPNTRQYNLRWKRAWFGFGALFRIHELAELNPPCKYPRCPGAGAIDRCQHA